MTLKSVVNRILSENVNNARRSAMRKFYPPHRRWEQTLEALRANGRVQAGPFAGS